MPRVTVQILDKPYSIACDEGEEDRVRQLGRMLDERVRRLARGGIGAAIPSDAHLLVLVGIALADELIEARRAPAAESDDGVALQAVEHLAARVEDIAQRLRQP